jgi:hypothetical protein
LAGFRAGLRDTADAERPDLLAAMFQAYRLSVDIVNIWRYAAFDYVDIDNI